MVVEGTRIWLICSLFKNLSSNKKGTILSVSGSDVKICKCKFNNIYSSSFPGCIFINEGSILMINCLFNTCHAYGDDNAYSKTCHIISSTAIFKHFSSVFCGPSTSSLGDSANAFEETYFKVNFYNASHCYGNRGSSSLLLVLYKEGSEIRYLNSESGIDYDSFETRTSDVSLNVYFSNFVNTTRNAAFSLSFRSPTYFFGCSFILMHSTFCSEPHKMFLTNCTSDKQASTYKLTTDLSQRVSFIVKINFYCRTRERMVYMKNYLVYVLMILVVCS